MDDVAQEERRASRGVHVSSDTGPAEHAHARHVGVATQRILLCLVEERPAEKRPTEQGIREASDRVRQRLWKSRNAVAVVRGWQPRPKRAPASCRERDLMQSSRTAQADHRTDQSQYGMLGRAIISQKIASTAAKAGKPKANHHQNSRW